MNKEELLEKFKQNVAYMRKHIPPDDIYEFAEETYMATLYFLSRWSEWVNVIEECQNDPIANKWVSNIMYLLKCRDEGIALELELGYKSMEDNDDSTNSGNV